MAANKDRSLLNRKEAIGKRPWPNLPHHLLNLLARKPNLIQPNLIQQISFPGTTKSWTTTTRRCTTTKHPQYPRLHDLEPDDSKWCSLSKTLPQFININIHTEIYPSFGYYAKSPPQFRIIKKPYFVGYFQGLLVTRGPSPCSFLVHRVSHMTEWPLPPWDVTIPFKFAAQSSTMVVVTGISSPALVVQRCDKDGCLWVNQECNVIDPYDAKKQTMQFTNIIYYESKLYALSLQGSLVVMEDISSDIVITRIGPSRAVPSVNSRYFKEHLFESKGEILLVFLIYRKTLDIVDQVEVFRLHFPRLSWIKVESLDERALFLEKECCIWVDSSDTNCRKNSVYFTQNVANEWYTYDMETGSISPSLDTGNN